MKISDLYPETILFELRREVGKVLAESIIEYLKNITTILKDKKPEEIFTKEDPLVDLEQLASMITGLKVLSNPDYRKTITDEDIGFNPTSAKDFFHMLDSIPKDGKNTPKLTATAFQSLKAMAPNLYQKEIAAANEIKDGDEDQRKAAISRLGTLTSKVEQMFNILKTKARSSSVANAIPAAAATDKSIGVAAA